MTSMKSLTLSLIVAVFVFGATRAGDAANLELIGFSKDGAHVAFEQFGEQDGSGFRYSRVAVVRVDQNKLVYEVAQTVEDPDKPLKQARDAARAKASATLKRFAIVTGNQGRFFGLPPKLADRIAGYQSANLEMLGRSYTLEATSADDPVPAKDICFVKPQLLTVKLQWGQQVRVLQRDSRLPASRQCAYDYELRSAHLVGRSLAVFVSYKTTGFEGPDLRWLVVTARL
jgi:predicted secreted protein